MCSLFWKIVFQRGSRQILMGKWLFVFFNKNKRYNQWHAFVKYRQKKIHYIRKLKFVLISCTFYTFTFFVLLQNSTLADFIFVLLAFPIHLLTNMLKITLYWFLGLFKLSGFACSLFLICRLFNERKFVEHFQWSNFMSS